VQAVKTNNVEEIELLASQNPQLLTTRHGSLSQSLLHFAASEGHYAVGSSCPSSSDSRI